jgi:hypothetical protein
MIPRHGRGIACARPGRSRFRARLVRAIGPLGPHTALVVNGVIGSSIFGMPPSWRG